MGGGPLEVVSGDVSSSGHQPLQKGRQIEARQLPRHITLVDRKSNFGSEDKVFFQGSSFLTPTEAPSACPDKEALMLPEAPATFDEVQH